MNLKVLLVCICLPCIVRGQTVVNVTNYGAVGNENIVWVNTTSNSVTVQFTNSMVGTLNQTIELFAVGQKNIGPSTITGLTVTNYQDLIAIITNIVNGTNVQISGDIPQQTSNNVYCIYGTNNTGAFQAAVNAAAPSGSTTVNVPAGAYLMIPWQQYTNYTYNYYPFGQMDAGILINKGGLNFVGAGPGKTVLVSDGAYKNQGGTCMRGGIFIVNGPITNDYPLIWSNLTFDAGLQVGLVGYENNQPANWVDGLGWDGTSFAGLDAGADPLNTFKEFANCEFRHFRGEAIKGITGSCRNETILVTNCFAWDGNATVFNYNFPHTITGCTFSNMYQIEEFYLKYPTNAPSYFINNYATNIGHELIALNGGTLTNEPYIISNNVFVCNMNGNGIATCPASSVLIVSNYFQEVNSPQAYTIAVCIGQEGTQPGSADAFNTNIVIMGNTFSNAFYTYVSAGGTNSTDQNRASNVKIINNSLVSASGGLFLNFGGWITNIVVDGNNAYGTFVPITSGKYYDSPIALVTTNNNYWNRVFVNGDSGIFTNNVDYGGGSRYVLTYPFATNAIVCLNDLDASQIPSGAQIWLNNSNWSGSNVPVYLNAALTAGPIILTNGQLLQVNWNQLTYQWQTNPVTQSGSLGTYVSGIIAKGVIMR